MMRRLLTRLFGGPTYHPVDRDLPRVVSRFSVNGRLIEITGKDQKCRT